MKYNNNLINLKRIDPIVSNIDEVELKLNASERDIPFNNLIWNEFINNLTDKNIRYYPNIFKIKKKLANYLDCDLTNITLAEGSDRVLKNIFECFAYPGSTVLDVTPSFPMYKIYSKIYGANYISVPYKTYNFPYEEFCNKISKDTNIVVISNPCSPIGDQLTLEQVKNIHTLCIKHDVILVVDEAYRDFANNIVDLSNFINEDNIILVRSFSKIFGSAGIRVGFSLNNKKITNILNLVKATNEISSISGVWVNTMLNNIQHTKFYVDKVKINRLKFENFLKNNNIEYISSNTNFVNIKLSKKINNFIKVQEKYMFDAVWTRISIPADEKNLNKLINEIL